MVAVARGDYNIMTKVGGGASVMAAKGKMNLAVKYGDGLHAGLLKGDNNANIQIGNGLGIFAAHGQRNLMLKIGDGDLYGAAISGFGKTKSAGTAPAKVTETAKEAKAVGDVAKDFGLRRDQAIGAAAWLLQATTMIGAGIGDLVKGGQGLDNLGASAKAKAASGSGAGTHGLNTSLNVSGPD